jgi:hypothetical protein
MALAMTPAQKVAAYIKLRDHIKQAKEEFESSIEKPKLAMAKLEAELLDDLNKSGADSIAAKGVGTVYRNTQYSATVENREAFIEFVNANGWDAVDLKANKTFVREYITEKGAIPPGVKFTQVETVGIRRS